MDDKSELIACIETGNFAKAARIAAGKCQKNVHSCVLRKFNYF